MWIVCLADNSHEMTRFIFYPGADPQFGREGQLTPIPLTQFHEKFCKKKKKKSFRYRLVINFNQTILLPVNAFLSSVDVSFIYLFFTIKSFRNTIRVSNSLDPDQARHFVGPDLGPDCLQRLSADDKSRHLRGKS